MRQCPDCEEKDRVVIAGKVFCANCGTPWQPTDTTEEATYKQKIGMDAAPVQAAVAASAQSATPVAPTPAPTPAPPQVTPTPAPASPTVAHGTAAAPTPPAPQPQSVAQAPAAPATTPTAVPAPTPAAVPSPVAPVVAPPSDKPLADLQSQIGSEIPNLDAKEESVLSDSQMKEMASVPVAAAPSQPAPVAETPPAPAPITAPVQQPSAQVLVPPASPAPATAPQQVNKVVNDIVAPTANVTPAPSPAIPAESTTTVAGVTMSREDALKLALGEDAAPQAATKAGPARPTAVVMTVIGLALLGAFLWQVNATDIQVKLASLRAGLTASVPGFVPGGWSKAQSLKASEGGVSYELVKDGKALKVEQQKSDWDSQAVLEQYVLRRSTDYLALQSQGLTIYMYGDNQAAWVNQGTFYTLSGDHGIEQDDIIRMATSL